MYTRHEGPGPDSPSQLPGAVGGRQGRGHLGSSCVQTILYYTILYYTILYYTILYYTILYYTVIYCNIIYYNLT